MPLDKDLGILNFGPRSEMIDVFLKALALIVGILRGEDSRSLLSGYSMKTQPSDCLPISMRMGSRVLVGMCLAMVVLLRVVQKVHANTYR